MHSCGNDYIFFKQNGISSDLLPALSRKISDRHKGVGSDGIIALKKSGEDIIFKMFNSDGSEGKICGNGIRMAALYASKHFNSGNEVEFLTDVGRRKVLIEYQNGKPITTAYMGCPKLFLSSGFFCEKLQNVDLYVAKRDVFAVNVGNDHAVFFSGLPLDMTVKHVNNCGLFPNGINVECAEMTSKGLKVEVFERGSGKTLACGSGAVAAVFAGIKSGRLIENEYVKVFMSGGALEVKISDGDAYLKGETTEICEGEYEI